jgi:hypothetical protein
MRQLAQKCIAPVGPIAQSVEQRTFNPWVDGSSPSGPTFISPKAGIALQRPSNTPLTLNAGFRLAYPIDWGPDSGRLVIRCFSAKALRSIPSSPNDAQTHRQTARQTARFHGNPARIHPISTNPKIYPPRQQHLPSSGVLTSRGQDVAFVL